MTADRPRRSRSPNTPTPTTAYALIGSTDPKSRSRFSLNSAAARWHSSRSATYRAELSIAAETSSYLGKVGANLRRELRPRAYIAIWNVISAASQANLEHICCDQNNATLRHAERLSCGGR